jgi:hypothetical protein
MNTSTRTANLAGFSLASLFLVPSSSSSASMMAPSASVSSTAPLKRSPLRTRICYRLPQTQNSSTASSIQGSSVAGCYTSIYACRYQIPLQKNYLIAIFGFYRAIHVRKYDVEVESSQLKIYSDSVQAKLKAKLDVYVGAIIFMEAVRKKERFLGVEQSVLARKKRMSILVVQGKTMVTRRVNCHFESWKTGGTDVEE